MVVCVGRARSLVLREQPTILARAHLPVYIFHAQAPVVLSLVRRLHCCYLSPGRMHIQVHRCVCASEGVCLRAYVHTSCVGKCVCVCVCVSLCVYR